MSKPQNLRALAKANRVRYGHAATVREIAAMPREKGERQVAKLLRKPPARIRTLKIRSLLGAVNRRGPASSERLLSELNLTNRQRIRDLTTRERDLLAEAVRRGYRTEDFVWTGSGFARRRQWRAAA